MSIEQETSDNFNRLEAFLKLNTKTLSMLERLKKDIEDWNKFRNGFHEQEKNKFPQRAKNIVDILKSKKYRMR